MRIGPLGYGRFLPKNELGLLAVVASVRLDEANLGEVGRQESIQQGK